MLALDEALTSSFLMDNGTFHNQATNQMMVDSMMPMQHPFSNRRNTMNNSRNFENAEALNLQKNAHSINLIKHARHSSV